MLALGVAASFAALGQWQLDRSVDNVQVVEIDTEAAVPLVGIAEPGRGVTEVQAGRLVTVTGEVVPDDFVMLTGRSLDGRAGSWLVAHLVTEQGDSLAVALGFTADGAAAPDLGIDRVDWLGRYLPSEEPQSSDFESGEMSAMSVAALVNLWADPGPVYAGFLVAADPPPGYEQIEATAPEREVTLNWLNLFYAIEWALFAGFAIYLWYRLVRDVVEREEAQAATID